MRDNSYIVIDLCSGLNGWTSGIPPYVDTNYGTMGSVGSIRRKVVVISVELFEKFNPTICADLTDPNLLSMIQAELAKHGRFAADLILFSPPCQGFSIASCSTHWTPPPERMPKTEKAKKSQQIVKAGLEIIKKCGCAFVMENPRGLLRKMEWLPPIIEEMGAKRHTITYCKYGDRTMKPTDLWTNFQTWTPRPMCKNFKYDSNGEVIDRHCHHESARRGAKTGTQGKKGNALRSVVPEALSREVWEAFLDE